MRGCHFDKPVTQALAGCHLPAPDPAIFLVSGAILDGRDLVRLENKIEDAKIAVNVARHVVVIVALAKQLEKVWA